MTRNKRIVAAITGASGGIYGIRLVKALVEGPVSVHLIISGSGKQVMAHENGYDGEDFTTLLKGAGVRFHSSARLRIHKPDDFFTPPASGSFKHQGMVIAPCSMKTLGAIAAGMGDGLINRAADVSLKEKRPLILLVRETPLSLIHIENMRRVATAGATVMPACPGFYAKARTPEALADTLVARILDHLDIEHRIMGEWGKDLV